jgi:hypothetical protein
MKSILLIHLLLSGGRFALVTRGYTRPTFDSFPTSRDRVKGVRQLSITEPRLEPNPNFETLQEYGYDRSDMEQAIFTALAYQGWTDEEIITFATVYRLPRHLQEWARHKDYSWTNRSLRGVRQWMEEHPPSPTPSIEKGMCIGSDSKGSYSHTDRNKALRLVTGAQTTRELGHTWMTELPNHPSESTAYRMLKQFKKHGIISKKASLWELTDLGRHHTATKMNYLMVLPKIRDEQAS